MSDDLKKKVQSQFSAAAEAYAASDVHARGESLNLLVEWVKPQSHWQALDVATGAGHTALVFAPHVCHMTACDLTQGMLTKTAELAAQRNLTNLTTKLADAEQLLFDDNSFDLLLCRLSFHHFPNPHQALNEFARVLKSDGILGFTDNITVPEASAADDYNRYEKLRDPSHHWVYPLPHLEAMMGEANFKIQKTRTLTKEFEFHDWADRQHVSDKDKERLLEMMREAPEALNPLFAPSWAKGTMYFSLWEAVIVAKCLKADNQRFKNGPKTARPQPKPND